jgi:hypothetical protein
MRDQLLRKEKDEASLFRVCEPGFPECLHSPILRGLRVFYFSVDANRAVLPDRGVARRPALFPQTSLWSLNQKPSAEFVQRTN